MKEIIFILIFYTMLPSWRESTDKLRYIEYLSEKIVFWSRYSEPRLDPVFVMTLIQLESGYDSEKINKNGKATGLMQIMSNGVANFGYSQQELLNIDKNLIAGISHLQQGIKQCGNNYKHLYGWYRSKGNCKNWSQRDRYFWQTYNKNIELSIKTRRY